jgi:hypothetical protein
VRLVRALLAGLALGATAPALAATVSAQRPESLAEALKGAGPQAVLGTDDVGDPVIDAVMEGYKARVLFLDCDESRHDKCGSIQFQSSFDAEGTGLSPADAIAFARRYRYAAVTLNASGDPTLRWDVETGEGIPREVFLAAAARFLGTVQAMGQTLFPSGTAAR